MKLTKIRTRVFVTFCALSVVALGVTSLSVAGAANAHANYEAVCPAQVSGVARCDALVITNGRGNPVATSTPAAGAYGPAQFHGGYNLPTTSPVVQTIGIVDAYNDPKIASDLATYDAYYGLPACTSSNGCLTVVNQTGGSKLPRNDSDWSLEISLDVETAHEICQNCKIVLVEASSSSIANLGTAVNEAASLGANVISNSYGSSEYSGEVSDQNSYYNHPGVMITASSGDSGYGVEFPAASRYVTAVGGTTLNLTTTNAYLSESAWSSGGSGCSAYITKPSWQSDTGCANRTVVDVAADADPNTGAAVYDSVKYQGQSGWFQVGGTSLASPLIGATYALAGNASSLTYGSYPYAHASSLHDVTTGSNGSCGGSYLCTAGVGYDGPTGMGSPDGTGGF
jgi:subtilase family serine protease